MSIKKTHAYIHTWGILTYISVSIYLTIPGLPAGRTRTPQRHGKPVVESNMAALKCGTNVGKPNELIYQYLSCYFPNLVLAFLLEFLSAFHLSNHVILDTVFLGFSIACFTARQPKHICKKCFHLITARSREKPMAFRAFRWHLERSLGHAPCDLDRHMPLPTSRSQGWSRGHIPLPQANFSKMPAGARWLEVGPGDLELARYSFKSKGHTAKHRIVQENDDQALEDQVVGRACYGGIY